ncbi:MAG: hypothetical protein ACRD0K_27825, partial [Egibacteraceae bacterium]
MPRGERGWWNRGVGGIGAASFLSDLGQEVPTALLPSLLNSTLDARRSTLDARRSTLDARRSTLDARRSTLDARR